MSFKFKQFSIEQDRCGMKVSTDGVILGAWAGQNLITSHKLNPTLKQQNILDIGTGTGLLSLMLAQQFVDYSKQQLTTVQPTIKITAIEIDPDAKHQAQQNVARSPFNNCIEVVAGDVMKWATSNVQRFDAIICNPPYFSNSLTNAQTNRTQARHDESLNFAQLLSVSFSLLNVGGSLSVVIPYSEETRFLENIKNEQWDKHRRLVISHIADSTINRVCLQLVKREGMSSNRADFAKQESIAIRKENGEFDAKMINLCRAFYLKM